MSNAPRASQLSGSTAFTSAGSINSFASTSTITPAQNGGPVIATANIINQKADASRSLYQICMSLKQRLAQVPGFDPYLQELDPTDPVESLWSLFRTGYPFLDIYNALQPEKPLEIDGPNAAASESKKSKIAIFKFIQACLKELGIPSAECFVISDVLGNDTTGFVKVCESRLFAVASRNDSGFDDGIESDRIADNPSGQPRSRSRRTKRTTATVAALSRR